MTQTNGHPRDPESDPRELLSLPPGDPQREAFLQQLPAADRPRWAQEFALSDTLRHRLSDVQIPLSLQRRLLSLNKTTTIPPVSHREIPPFHHRPTTRIAAALLLTAGLIAVYLLRPHPPAPPAHLDAAVAKTIATLAVQNHAAPLAIASGDPAIVKKSLDAGGLDVPIVMLTPSAGTVLQGGGTCDFGGTKAAFTQWKNGDFLYTLYEFNGAKLGAPGSFFSSMLRPRELWRGDLHYQVAVFPGEEGKCCWALVMESENAQDVFSRYVTGY